MPYRYLENIAMADIAFEAWGKTPEEMIMSACTATENVMIENIQCISPAETRHIHIKEDSLEMLIFRIIEELIFLKDSENLFLLPSNVVMEGKNNDFFLDLTLQGEKINPGKHNLGVDVKGITLYNFKVEKTAGQWKATVVLDI